MIGNISFYKDKENNFVAQITIGQYDNGKPKYKRFKGKKKKDVIQRANEFQLNYTGKIEDKEEFYLEDFLRGYLRNVKKGVLKPASYSREESTLEKHIIPYIGHFNMYELSSDIIQNMLINELLEKKYSYSTIHKAYIFLNSALNNAVMKGILDKNPCMAVKEPSKKIFDKKPARFLNDEEINAFLEEAKKPVYKNGLAIATIIYTGLRGGELCALQWNDIDFEEKTVNINKNVAFYYEEIPGSKKKKRKIIVQHSTKRDDRVICLTEKASELFRLQKESSGERKGTDFVLKTNKPISVDVISKTYTIIAENAGISEPAGIHTLRHTFCSLLIRKNVDIKTVSELAGHKNVAFTYDTYVHLINKQKAKAIELLDL